MRTFFLGCLALSLAVAAGATSPSGARPKLDLPSSALIVPFFEVDTTSPGGQTTLFAVRNPSAHQVVVNVIYFTAKGAFQRAELVTLDAFETATRNVRDVSDLVTDPDGFARGFVQVVLTEPSPPDSPLVGDFFQIDVAGAFATGERVIADPNDFCFRAEVRFVDFGSPTELRVFLADAPGTDADDPVAFRVTPFAEDGSTTGPVDFKSDEFIVFMDAADVTTDDFGTLVFEFTGSVAGWVYAESSANGLFSVGLNGACTAQIL